MWNYAVGFVLALIQKSVSVGASLLYAPVPREEDTGGGGFTWTILGIVVGVGIGLLIFKLLGRSQGKRGR